MLDGVPIVKAKQSSCIRASGRVTVPAVGAGGRGGNGGGQAGRDTMGLDMYLEGTKLWTSAKDSSEKEDGFLLRKKILKLAYWRKHPDLHGYIVKTFAKLTGEKPYFKWREIK